ncbi:Bax inhibitor-like protein, partial [Globisporangium splendens]
MSMFSTSSSPTWDLQSMLKTSGISADVQQHLVRVYATLSTCVLTAALSAGAVLALSSSAVENAQWMGLLAFFGATGGSVWLHLEPTYNHQKRFGILLMVAASMGVSMSALIEIALEVDPSILITAFLMTTMVFLCFTGSALLATRRSYLYLGAILSSALSTMALLNFLNIFFRSTMLYSANLYGGLVVFCGYVVFDTQMIIEKASMGDKDSLRHALELFLDFVSIFVRIMVILIQNADKKKRAESSSKNRR